MALGGRLTRRGLLVGTAGAAVAGGGLLLAFSLVPRHYATPLRAGDGEHVFDAFIRMAADGAVSVAVPFCEMGQGIATLVAQIVAWELGADWRRVGVEPAPVSPVYADPVLAAHWAPLWMPLGAGMAENPDGMLARLKAEREPMMMTADGTALAAFEQPLRAAAASVRAMLSQAAAAEWNVGWEECEARDHSVIHGDKRLAFAALLEKALAYDPPDPPVLRAGAPAEKPRDFPEGARPRYPRLDLPAKADGSFVFAGDVRLPGMVFAAIAHGPQGNSVLSSHDKDAAAGVRGLVGVVHARRWLAAVATTWHAANKAVKAMEPRFRAAGPIADSATIDQAINTALQKGHPVRVAADGDPDALLDKAGPAKLGLVARYDVEPALHAPLETATATARLRDGKLELWVATQAPERVRRAGALAAGVSRADVIVYPMHAGGSFDARLDSRVAAEAAAIARQVGRPVQLVWSRWQEALAGLPRTPVSAELAGSLSADKQHILGWRARMALPPTAIESGLRLLHDRGVPEALRASRAQADPLACEGALPFYGIPEKAVDHLSASLPLPTARYRGNAHGYAAFCNESFVDELAHAGGQEPLAFRMGMLGGQPRLAACLSGVARMAMWGGGADASGQGIACHRMDLPAGEGQVRSGFIAVVATARQDEGAVRVDRLSVFCDIGRIVNMDIARQQVEGGLVFGLAQAIGGSTAYAGGLPVSGRLSQLGLPLLADCPKVDVAFAESSEEPFDPGELAVVAVAPAIANALFSATGLRFRRLPLLSEGL